jgi:hypothetical protein
MRSSGRVRNRVPEVTHFGVFAFTLAVNLCVLQGRFIVDSVTAWNVRKSRTIESDIRPLLPMKQAPSAASLCPEATVGLLQAHQLVKVSKAAKESSIFARSSLPNRAGQINF